MGLGRSRHLQCARTLKRCSVERPSDAEMIRAECFVPQRARRRSRPLAFQRPRAATPATDPEL